MTGGSSTAGASRAYTNKGSGKDECNYDKPESINRTYA